MGYKSEIKKGYQHFIPPVKLNPNWPSGYNFELVENLDHLKKVFSDFKDNETIFSFDIETSGLDPENDFIVGVGISFDGKTGYYIPINHYDKDYNMYDEALDIIYDYMTRAKRVLMYGGKFDTRYMEYYGYNKEEHGNMRLKYVKYDMSKVNIYDVVVPVWLSDTNIKMPSLEWSSLHFLGIKQASFKETTAGLENFYYVDPVRAAYYCGGDAICTYLLTLVTMKFFKEGGFASKLDNAIMYPLNHFERELVYISEETVKEQAGALRERIEHLEEEIYKDLGRVINLNSPQQVAEAFQAAGVDTGRYTKTGYMSTSIRLFENMSEEKRAKWPVIDKFMEYKQSFKILSSYVSVLEKEHKERGFLRCNYKINQVPTGRLASGKDGKNTYFSEINIQSIPKPGKAMFYVLDLDDRELYDKKQNIIMGYQFVLVQKDSDGKVVPGEELYGDKYLGITEGFDQKLNIRKAFLPAPADNTDWIWCSIDYAGQELRIPTNFSREPIWLDAFVNGKDVHKETAIRLMGENYDRSKAKGANFGILYGMTADSLAESFKMSKAEAQEFYNNYKSTLSTLFGWVDRLQRRARREGTAYTYFSRPRRIRFYFENGQAAFGYRTIVNTTVQGTGSDVLKISLLKLWKNMFNHPDYRDYIRFLTTVHDEVDVALRIDKIQETFRRAVKIMTFSLPEWPVTLEVEANLGFSWGNLFPFEIKNGVIVPILKN